MKLVYVALGSNLGDRLGHLQAAVERMESDRLRVRGVSRVFETAPMYLREQGWFLNAVVEAETDWFPMQLLNQLQRVERGLGRRRTVPNAPRTIDLDILLYGSSVIQSDRLVVPHPKMHERRFVLAPLADLAPELRHPVLRRTVRQMLETAPDEAVRPVPELRLLTPVAALASGAPRPR